MATLTLESERASYNWSALEKELAVWLPGFAPASSAESKRTYHLAPFEQDQQIPLLQKLQSLLTQEDVHFYIDLKP